MYPMVGEIVHYAPVGSPTLPDGTRTFEGTCRAAIVTERWTEALASLTVLEPTGMFLLEGCLRSDDEFTGGTWHRTESRACR